VSANAFPIPWDQDAATAAANHERAMTCDLLIVEDLQHLPSRAADSLVQLLDDRFHRLMPVVCTATRGPAQFARHGDRLPVRLTNRLAAGLVIALRPLQAPSRRIVLNEIAQRRGLRLTDDALNWLAQSLTGGRQLEGAIHQIQGLRQHTRRQPTLEELRRQFEVDADGGQPTIEGIVRQVSSYFRVTASRLRSSSRSRGLLIARQVTMYLARQLTTLSLQRIGASLGGRDHTTVQHGCKRIEVAIQNDASLAAAVRELESALA
jgi:chromosomal replication initiator protein